MGVPILSVILGVINEAFFDLFWRVYVWQGSWVWKSVAFQTNSIEVN